MTLEYILVRLLNGLYWARNNRPEGRDLVLGTTRTHNRHEPAIFREASRPMHLGVIGLSGVGKTYFLENLIRQDIDHQTGFVVFDVHGDLADSIVAYLAASAATHPELLDRVVIIEPFDSDYSIGFNPLERTPDTSPFVQAQELAHILRSRWETHSFGPRTEELLRSALYTLSTHDLTLLELPHILTNNAFRAKLISSLPERAVIDYWKGRYQRLSEPMKSMVREPLLTRVSAFLADPQIREIVGQRKSTFNFREAIARGLSVVINLSKGKLGENSTVLGSLLFTKLELDVMAQARTPEADRKLFAVYADELQNLVGSNFATLIAEARKYRVSITAGHQYWRQLPPEMRAAMLGVGSRVLFRLNYHDAVELAGELDPTQKQWYTTLLTRLPRGDAIFRTAADRPVPFTVHPHRNTNVTALNIAQLRDRSRALYAARRTAIREDINARYQKELAHLTQQRRGVPNPHRQLLANPRLSPHDNPPRDKHIVSPHSATL
jgi:hypothetical protein